MPCRPVWGTLHGLHNYFPETVPIATNVDPIHFILPIFDNLSELQFKFRFNILGFFYFLKTEIAFSLWFFQPLRQRPAHHICRLRRH